MTRRQVLTEALFIASLTAVSGAAIAGIRGHLWSWLACVALASVALGTARHRDANPPSADATSLSDRLICTRPFTNIVVAWRFWTALRAAEHPAFSDRLMWASAVMMTRAAKSKGIQLPCQIELTERLAAQVETPPEDGSQHRSDTREASKPKARATEPNPPKDLP